MDKKPLLIVCICAMVLLILASLSNVVGYQTVQSSAPHPIDEQNQVNNQLEQKQGCGCERKNTAVWHFPVLCSIIRIIYLVACAFYALASIAHNFNLIYKLEHLISDLTDIATVLNCR